MGRGAIFLGLAVVIFGTTPGFAGAPSAAQRAEFYQVCVGISGNQALCNCKADAALSLIDARMMDYVIAGMKGPSAAPADVQHAWNAYVAKSNQICKPNY